VNQGDVYWCTFPTPDKRRPVVILTRDSALEYLTSITVAPVTTTIREADSLVRIGPGDGLAFGSVVSLDNIVTVRKTRLVRYISHLSQDRMRAIRTAIEYALGFDLLDD